MKLRKARHTLLKCNQKEPNPKTKCDHNVKVNSVAKKRGEKNEGG